MRRVILTGDRPTGRLHLGHYVGSLSNRIKLIEESDYDDFFIMIADTQALTDNFSNTKKVSSNILEVLSDYLACGINPNKCHIFLQSKIQELYELTSYFLNIVTLERVKRNPTVKQELIQKNFQNTIPLGFLIYPISQAADILLFFANTVPVGKDQAPMIEQANEIVLKFNSLYKDTFSEIKALYPLDKSSQRLIGIDGASKMSKSLDNCIYLSDEFSIIKEKVMRMYTDSNHIKISDPGKVEGNVVFTYLDAFSNESHFKKYMSDYNNLDELKKQYTLGGVGDVFIKNFLINILEELISPIREKKKELLNNKEYLMEVLNNGTNYAKEVARKNLDIIKKNMGFFDL